MAKHQKTINDMLFRARADRESIKMQIFATSPSFSTTIPNKVVNPIQKVIGDSKESNLEHSPILAR